LRINAQFYGFAVHTYEAGKLVDEARATGLQSYIRAQSLATVPRSVQGLDSAQYNNPGWQKPAFVSSGPEIQWLNVQNWGTTDLAYENTDWTRVELLAASPAGLKEVRLYDNARLWRRFLPGGAKSFQQVVDAYHDCQDVYAAEAVDINGGTALSWSRETDVQECWHEMCGDNWNDMTGGKYTLINAGIDTRRTGLAGTEFSVSLSPTSSPWLSPSLPNLPHGAPRASPR
jgi:hypothetical protein